MSELAYRQKIWKQSLDYINIAIQLSNGQSHKSYYLFKTNSLIQLGESSNAVLCLNEYLAMKLDDSQALHKLAKEHNKLSQWKML